MLQEATLQALASEQALELLPPLSRLPGGPLAYLAQPSLLQPAVKSCAQPSSNGSNVAVPAHGGNIVLPPPVLEQLVALLAAGQLGLESGDGPAAAGDLEEPGMLADFGRHYVLAHLLEPRCSGGAKCFPAPIL